MRFPKQSPGFVLLRQGGVGPPNVSRPATLGTILSDLFCAGYHGRSSLHFKVSRSRSWRRCSASRWELPGRYCVYRFRPDVWQVWSKTVGFIWSGFTAFGADVLYFQSLGIFPGWTSTEEPRASSISAKPPTTHPREKAVESALRRSERPMTPMMLFRADMEKIWYQDSRMRLSRVKETVEPRPAHPPDLDRSLPTASWVSLRRLRAAHSLKLVRLYPGLFAGIHPPRLALVRESGRRGLNRSRSGVKEA